MSIVLRSLLRNPQVGRYARPSSRALRRWDDFFEDEWPVHRRHPMRVAAYDPWADDSITREFENAVSRLNELAEEMDMTDHWLSEKRAKLGEAGELTMQRSSDGGLQLAMDVSGYKPENLNIELVDDHLVVEAKNETSQENSYSKSEIRRWFKLPEGCKVEDIKSNLTADNRLLISLPGSKPALEHKTRKIPIKVDQKSQPQIENQSSNNQSQSQQKQHADQQASDQQTQAKKAANA